ncbi:MAG: pyridoxamine 5'-phosphate oxidase family protein [Acidimicrobiales bacterium]|nr:pyridoxamine 5'-phosphate oxidase family protein [Acidimicrobiales bacterium]
MGLMLERLDAKLTRWIARQPMFFVATAPSDGGRVNLSPKGHDTLRVLDESTVAYLDLTGSGVETIAHIRENGRITVMLCAFWGPPLIVRLSGTGEVAVVGEPAFEEQRVLFPDLPGSRAVVTVHLDRVQTSCGYAVPRMELVDERDTLLTWAERKGDDGLERYRAKKNAESVDGVPGLLG